MPTYTVKVIREDRNAMGNGTNRWPMAHTVAAPDAAEAISRTIAHFKREGWSDSFWRFPEAENVNDGHDCVRYNW